MLSDAFDAYLFLFLFLLNIDQIYLLNKYAYIKHKKWHINIYT